MATTCNILLLSILLSVISRSSSCPEGCMCIFNTVDCTDKGLRTIPKNIGNDASVVTMNRNPFTVTVLEEGNFTGMIRVKTLSLMSCGIQRIKRDTFRDIHYLTELNLQDNKISVIDNFAFRDTNLMTLTLDNNKDIRFERDTFTASYTKQLFLRKCNLQKLPNLLPLKGSLKKLFLEQNKLVFLPRNPTKAVFLELTTLALAKNPLQCTCTNSWLAEIGLKKLEPLEAVGQDRSDVKARCHDPFNYRGVNLDALQRSDYKCTRPVLSDIFVDLSENRARLRCAAQSEEEPVVSWRAQGVEQQSIIGYSTNELIYQRLANDSVLFECLARNRDKDDPADVASLRVHVVWPQSKKVAPLKSNKPIETTGSVENKRLISSSPFNNTKIKSNVVTKIPSVIQPRSTTTTTNFMTDRQFTLLELIGAVVGTFTGTLLFFVLTCQCITWYKKREKKRWSTYGPAYSQTYSTPHTTGDYDVPHIGKPSLPCSASLPVSAMPMEFSDFKMVQQLHYPKIM